MIKKILNRILHILYYEYISNFKSKIKKVHKKYKQCIIFIATPTHGNLGDQAIVYAQYNFLKVQGLDNKICEVTTNYYNKYFKVIEKAILPNDIIVIDGGGSMGTLWINEEYKMQDIVKRFPNNKIIIFPQTIYYSDDEYGIKELERSVMVYTNHKDLHICARDLYSYNLMKKIYLNINIMFMPDIVLYLNNIERNYVREGAILCFRSDKEKSVDDSDIEHITSIIKKFGLKTRIISTIKAQTVYKETRKKVLNTIWYDFSKSKIVITDRLHGMIFATITGTPCLALNNKSGKVKGVYEWIKYLPYIKYIENIDEVNTYIEDLLNINNFKYNNKILIPHFNQLIDLLK